MGPGPAIRIALVIVAAAVAGLVAAQSASAATLRARLHAALAGFDGPGTAVLAVDLASGKAVYAHNAASALLPASNEKLVVSYAALQTLGPAFRMQTSVLGEGHLGAGGVWSGSLVLRGGGDPTLDRAGLARLAHDVRAAGVRRVSGNLVADESWFDARRSGPGWKAGFVPEESQALSALAIEGVDGALGTARLFREALLRAGVRVTGATKLAHAGGWPLAVRWSPPLRNVLHHMDVESDNFTAELIFKQLGAVAGRGGTTAAGAAVARSVLAEHAVPLAGVRIADGSGLSALDRLTPKAIVTILQRSWADPATRSVLFGLLPVSGGDGTLENRMTRPPARGNVHAKTGTLDNVSALSGYVRGRYAFAILVNAPRLSSYAAHAAQDRFATVLAEQAP
jgi:D-alanyl-D-alanine carboxypeptidase/D-alanyl-D-alanine-endopeptidase (penicillin-binding protein 4)